MLAQQIEPELRKYMAIEVAVGALAAYKHLGPLRLDTTPLKANLKTEAASWKNQFAKNIQRQGAEDLKACKPIPDAVQSPAV